MSLEKFSRRDMQVGIAGIVLLIGLLAFPWFSFSAGVFSASETATGAPDGWLGILALIVVVALLASLALERLRPDVQVPSLAGGHDATRRILAIAAAALLALKFLFHIHFSYFGWGFYVDVVAVAVLVYSTLGGSRVLGE